MSDSAVKRAVGLIGATAGVLAAGTAAGVLTQRKGLGRRRTAAAKVPLGSVRGIPRTVITGDGLSLYAEVDESPTAAPGRATVVFVHGYALNLDCWHFQRLALRGEHRLVLYDQRSHGRSPRSQPEHCTIDALGEDLGQVVEQLVPEGPVVLVGHSMGGMTILALAQLHPEWFGRRVVGVVLVSTSADGMGDVTFGLPRGMARVLNDVSPSMLLALARVPKLVERGRRMGSGYAFAITQRLAFGGRVPREYVHFTDQMLSATPVDVLACFYPEFARLDKAQVLLAEDWPPTTIICGSRDLFTPVRLSRRMAEAVPSSRLVEIADAGHLLMLERSEQVNEEISALLRTVELPSSSP
ncbi:MAG: alpha/beta fold hydrolase [Nocardioidaceae bacterium]